MSDTSHPRKDLFFIALLPDAGIRAEVTRFKEYAARHFDSAHALRSPPHITLFPPFRWPDSREPELEAALRRFADGEQPFPVELRNFAAFAPRVIFVDVVRSEPLESLYRRLRQHLQQGISLRHSDDRPFHPHMTVAFRDLARPVFPRAWAYFSNLSYERRFPACSLALLRHERQGWTIQRQFDFPGPKEGEKDAADKL